MVFAVDSAQTSLIAQQVNAKEYTQVQPKYAYQLQGQIL